MADERTFATDIEEHGNPAELAKRRSVNAEKASRKSEENPAGLVELRGIEPLTSAVRLQRSPI